MDIVNYQSFLNEVMLELVRIVLNKVKTDGLPENNSIYFSFQTDNPMVKLSERVKQIYPKEITIVLQYQFHHLKIELEYFSVIISFDGIKETVHVPFSSLTGVIDPNNGFSLKLNPEITKLSDLNKNNSLKELENTLINSKSSNKIVILDNFRNNNKD